MALTRRKLLALGPAHLGAILSWSHTAGEFWDAKQPSEWSPAERERILSKSPWAKEVTAEFQMRCRGEMGGPGSMGPPPGGIGESGMGGPPGGMAGPGMGGPPEFAVVVRWETALPVREVLRTALPPESEDHYVISVTGLPMLPDRPGPRRPEGNEQQGRERMVSQIMETSELQRKGKAPLIPDQVVLPPASLPQKQSGDPLSDAESGILLFFPHGAAPIQLADKEVTLTTRLGPFTLKAKFVLKNMVYRDQLTL